MGRRRMMKRRGRRKLQSKAYDPTGGSVASAFARAVGGFAAAKAGKAIYNTFRKRGGRKIPVSGGFSARPLRRSRLQPRRNVNFNAGVKDGTGGYSQWTQRYQTGKFGRLTPRKIDKLSLDTVIFRHQLIGPFNDKGQRYLYNAANTAGDLFYPLMLYELNSANNYINGTLNTMNPVYQMYQPAATTNIAFQAVAGQDPTGTTISGGWLTETSGHTQNAVASHPMSNSIHKWSSIDFELWGQTQKPTMYTVNLCQFNEDVLPATNFVSNIGYYSTITDPNACEFWQSMIKRYVYSPLAKINDGYGNKKIKILKQYKINIDPTANYENDPDPHVKTLKLFYRFNRKCNFEWKFSNANPQTINNMGDADWQQEDGENQCQVHPNARMFVMVRASNFTRGTVEAATNATNPSISWVMRTCHLVNQ